MEFGEGGELVEGVIGFFRVPEEGGGEVVLLPEVFLEDGGDVFGEGEEVAASAGGGSDGGVVFTVELGEGGVDPSGGELDAVAVHGGDFFEAFLECGGEVTLELFGTGAGALGDEVEVVGGEADPGAVDDFGEDPEAEGFLGVFGGVADAEAAVFESAQLAQEDTDHGPVGAEGCVGAGGFLDLLHDLSGEGFMEEEEEEAHGSSVQTSVFSGQMSKVQGRRS